MPNWAGLLQLRHHHRKQIMAAHSSKAGSSGCNKKPTQNNLARLARKGWIPLAIECPCKQCALWALT